MRKVLRFFVFLFFAATLALVSYFVYQHFQKKNRIDIFKALPQSTIAAIKTERITEAWQQLSGNKIWKALVKTEHLGDFQETIVQLENYAQKGGVADIILRNRPMIASVHPVSGNELGVLFVVDLQQAQGIKWLDIASSLSNQEIEKEAFKTGGNDYTISTVKNIQPNMHLSYTFAENLLVASTHKTIIENSLAALSSTSVLVHQQFRELEETLSDNANFKLFMNYKKLTNLTNVFMNESDTTFNQFEKDLLGAGMQLDIRESEMELHGQSFLDSIPSYFRALAAVEPAATTVENVITNKAAALVTISYSDFESFRTQMQKQHASQDQKSADEYKENILLVEKLLGVNLQHDFFSWMGNGISLAKLRPSNKTRPEDMLVAIHTQSAEDAEAKLNNVMAQVKKRSPLKFKTYSHRNYNIHYLEMKGFFRLFFGAMFSKMEKPFFTIINDHVVFSNSLEVLKQNISDYINGATLAKDGSFVDFKNSMNPEANISMVVQMPKTYASLFQYSKAETQKSLKENKELLTSFAMFGLQMTGKKDALHTSLLCYYDSAALAHDELELMQEEAQADQFHLVVQNLEFAPTLADSTLQTEGIYQKFSSDSTLLFQANIAEGAIFGEAKIFYPSGHLLATVNYSDSQLNGNTLFYFDQAVPVRKAQVVFEEGKVKDTYYEFYPSGQKKTVVKFDDGLADGKAQFFYIDGQLQMEGVYKKGLKHGKWTLYDDKGVRFGDEKWKKGVRKR